MNRLYLQKHCSFPWESTVSPRILTLSLEIARVIYLNQKNDEAPPENTTVVDHKVFYRHSPFSSSRHFLRCSRHLLHITPTSRGLWRSLHVLWYYGGVWFDSMVWNILLPTSIPVSKCFIYSNARSVGFNSDIEATNVAFCQELCCHSGCIAPFQWLFVVNPKQNSWKLRIQSDMKCLA